MDREFWIKTAITFFVATGGAIIGAIIKPVAAAKVADFFSARQLKRSRKERETQLRQYAQIKAFRDGTKDKQAFYITVATVGLSFLILAAVCILAALLMYATDRLPFERVGIVLLVGIVFVLAGLLAIAAMSTTATRLEKFDEYQKQVKDRWPDA